MKLEFTETQKNGFKDKMNVTLNGSWICSFTFNMTGYVPNFDLQNCEGVLVNFGERSAKKHLRTLKISLDSGFNWFNPHPMP